MDRKGCSLRGNKGGCEDFLNPLCVADVRRVGNDYRRARNVDIPGEIGGFGQIPEIVRNQMIVSWIRGSNTDAETVLFQGK